MQISIIIPILNEGPRLEVLLPWLMDGSDSGQVGEILVVDGGSTDHSREVALRHGARYMRSGKGRAIQMNAGAQQALGDILYFLHADSLPPPGYDSMILQAMSGEGRSGCFRVRFEPSHWMLDFFSWFSRINLPLCRGGDQSLFIPRSWFESLNGFDERYRIYEDNEFIGRIYRHYPFSVLPKEITTSSRRYQQQGFIRLQYHYAAIHLRRFLGHGPETLYAYYEKHINGMAPEDQ